MIILLLIALSFGAGGTALIYSSFRTARERDTRHALEEFAGARSTLSLLYSFSESSGYAGVLETMKRMEEEGYGDWEDVEISDSRMTLYSKGRQEAVDYDLTVPQRDECSILPVDDAYGRGLVLLSIIRVGQTELSLRARYNLSEAYESFAAQQRLFLVSYAAVVLIGAVASLLLSSALTDPLRRMARAARRITEGDLDVRSGLRTQDEFGELSRDFDSMADSLQEKIGELEDDLDRQEAFIGAFAHELKTPMTSIIGFTDILRQGDLDEKTRIQAADYIYNEGRRLERLSFKLLDLLLTKNDSISMRPVDLTGLLRDTERMLSAVMRERGIRLSVRSGGGTALMEPDLMKSLLYNLIDNASKAIDGEGRIDVAARALPDGAVFAVRDTGRGMQPEELAHITEAFYRVDKARSRSQGGAGLGLALCSMIVQLHGGQMQFESEPGKGTTVTVTIHTADLQGPADGSGQDREGGTA